eukprot:CAMPEP_0183723896 /NCGR_PEP_ID=MMETSP0737-20130205/16681_1 /TAXON_ID=385413 /ORGANISM="Thalassiosira miniscula, Strain CCMP1093" /LENGTH=204 /DNA_ID=CAMNT_0025954315 /DNA_START=25 /DNA_END=639 /DNA_ORIENTATION=+
MMKTAACLLALVGSAAAFAPAQQGRVNTAVAAFEDELGAQAPLGFWDPLGMLEGADQAEFDRLRKVEIKHGRVSMLAVVGYLTTASGYRFDDYPADVPAGLGAWKALASTPDGVNVLGQMAVFFALAELINRSVPWGDSEPRFPGDHTNGIHHFGWDDKPESWQLNKRAIELNQGRAAQMGILGLIIHEQMGVSILPGNIIPGQ